MVNTTQVIRHYLIAALWSSTDEHGEPLDAVFTVSDCSAALLGQAMEDCTDFVDAAGELLKGLTEEQIGHDFWLTRNHHGAGFWDRDLGNLGEELSALAHTYGSVDLYAGDDGWVYSV